MCWHRWSGWAIDVEGDLAKHRSDGEKDVIGYMVRQRRSCEKCGFVQVHMQNRTIDDDWQP